MSHEELLIDICERLARLETKVDGLIEYNKYKSKRWFDAGVRTWLALIAAITSVVIAIIT